MARHRFARAQLAEDPDVGIPRHLEGSRLFTRARQRIRDGRRVIERDAPRPLVCRRGEGDQADLHG
jgi:hypothetical protein